MAQLLSNLPIGAKVKFGRYSVEGEAAQDIIWLVVAKNHKGVPEYLTKSVTFLTEKAIDVRVFDAPEPNNDNADRQSYGNNRYSVSNIDQWLNKDNPAGQWYVAQHDADAPPRNANRPGFLNAFTAAEKNSIIMNRIRTVPVVGSVPNTGIYEDIFRQVYLPSVIEIGGNDVDGVDGAVWEYFISNDAATYLTSQAYENTLHDKGALSVTKPISWFTRTPMSEGAHRVRGVAETISRRGFSCNAEWAGIRPALNLSPEMRVSETTDGDGCYNIIYSVAPPAPSTIFVPTYIYDGKTHSISWYSVTDPDGDIVTYELECSYDGGNTYQTIYTGKLTNCTHLVPSGTLQVTYRVRAIDSFGESSDYTTSPTRSVKHNESPVISGSDTDLGVMSSGFTGTYTVTDADSTRVTVSEYIDGVQIRSFVATVGEEIPYGVTENTWLALPNGSHTFTIRATDGIDTSVRTYTFTKLVDSFTIRNSTPWVSDTMPTRIMLVVTRNIPSAATFKVEVCNNGYDATPTWEDCTDAVKSGLVHVFTNTTKSATNWGVLVRVTVERNGAAGACYISAIGGNFE